MWSALDDEKYRLLNISTHMCIQREGVQITGQTGSEDALYLYFAVSQCTSSASCASQTTIDTFLSSNLSFGRYFACSALILDTGLNPTSQNLYTYSVYEQTLWLMFTKNQQIITQLFLGTFQVITDTNFLPWVSQNTETGYFVSKAVVNPLVVPTNLTDFVQFYISLSPTHRVVNRTYGKFDEVLSYVGGLYGIVIGVLGIFLLSFNQYKYELRVSQGAFSFRDGHLAREADLHFFKYLKYVAFDWIKTFFCYKLAWKDCIAIDSARQQAIQQIDVKHLLKRISHLEKVISWAVKQEDEIAMYLSESNSLQEVKSRRSITQYCEKFSGLLNSATIERFEEIQNQLKQEPSGNPIFKVYPESLAQIKLQERIQQSQFQEVSLNLMQQYVAKFVRLQKVNDQMINLSQQERQAQQQISKAFFKLDQSLRRRIIKRIPLGLLYRISRKLKKSGQKQMNSAQQGGKIDLKKQNLADNDGS